MTSRRRRTEYRGRRGHTRRRPRGTWNRHGTALVVIVAVLLAMHHYGVTVHFSR